MKAVMMILAAVIGLSAVGVEYELKTVPGGLESLGLDPVKEKCNKKETAK